MTATLTGALAAVAELERLASYTQYQRGLTPEWARPMTPMEVRSRVNFAALDRIHREGYGRSAAVLEGHRAAIVEDLRETVAGITDPKVLSRVLATWAMDGTPGLRAARLTATQALRVVLLDAADQSGRQLMAEAAAQGVTVNPAMRVVVKAAAGTGGGDGDALLGEAQSPVAALENKLTSAALNESQRPSSADGPIKAVENTSIAGPLDLASQGVNIASGEGRSAVADELPDAKLVYSSELLDGNTCSPCEAIDGTEYDSLAAAEDDYPSSGPYQGCDGGARCRGTLVLIFADETPAVDEGITPPPFDNTPVDPDMPLTPFEPVVPTTPWDPISTAPIRPAGIPITAIWDPTNEVWIADVYDAIANEWVEKRYPNEPWNAPPLDSVEKAMPRLRMGPDPVKIALRKSNTIMGDAGQVNCQKTTTAYELRRRGIDATAGGGSGGPENSRGILSWFRTSEGHPPPVTYLSGGFASTERRLLAEQAIEAAGPPGSRGAMTVSWEKGGRHILNWERDAQGAIHYYDAQSGKAVGDATWWERAYPDKVFRMDNLVLINTAGLLSN